MPGLLSHQTSQMNKFHQNRFKFIVVALCGLAVSFPAMSQEKPTAPAEPAPIILPATAQRFMDFYSSQQLDFAIDPDSIVIQPGPDAEVRYTLRATSKTGAVNISYEAIRCSNRQKIIYAVGRKDGSWILSRAPEWSAIYVNGTNIQHATLANGYFCSVGSVAGKTASIIKRIESKKALNDSPG